MTEAETTMDIKLKLGYWLFGLSFIAPSFDLSQWGIQIATDCALSGVSLLISGFPSMLFGLALLGLFFVNFSILPGIEINKSLRIASAVAAILAGIIPQEGTKGETIFFITTPPFLLWATAIILINIIKIRRAETVHSSGTT